MSPLLEKRLAILHPSPMEDNRNYLNSFAPIDRHKNRLPHWQQDNATYFITIRLADSIPKVKLDRWRGEHEIWLRRHPEPWNPKEDAEYHERFSGKMEAWLDEMHGSCLLRSPGCANAVGVVLMKFDQIRFRQHAWVVMPNHAHILFSQLDITPLPETIRIWKGTSSNAVNAIAGKSGTLWQKDYFDRLIRNEKHFWNCAKYIRRNPKKANLNYGQFLLYESESVKSRLDVLEGIAPP